MSKQPELVTTSAEARQIVRDVRATGQRVGLVPTMGALHEGHLSLIRAAHRECDYVVVTIFVNPTQFAPDEDFEQYPRPLEEDFLLLQELAVNLVFAPHETEIYPEGTATPIEPPAVALAWEGTHRPQHFAGVATVVCKLFNILPANVVFFGQKDYQQAVVIQQLITDLEIPIELVVCPTIREANGLALSSRNQYLNEQQHAQAAVLSLSLQHAQQFLEQGERSTRTLVTMIRQKLEEAGIEQIDYIAIVHPATLTEVDQVLEPAMLLLAVHIGNVRLIDNCQLLP